MKPFASCPVCGGDLAEKQVEKIVRGGKHTAVMNVKADVCLRCGERLHDEVTVRKFEEVRAKLERQETSGFQSMGTTFQVA